MTIRTGFGVPRFMCRRAARSADNCGRTLALMRLRLSRRLPHRVRACRLFLSPPAHYRAAVTLCALMVVACLFVDDTVVARIKEDEPDIAHLARAVTNAALSSWYLYPAALILLVATQIDARSLSRRRMQIAYGWTSLAGLVLCAVGGAGVAVNILKQLFGRARPRLYEELGAFSWNPLSFESAFASFPSGHSATAGAVAGLVALLCPRLRLAIVLAGLALALSRVFVGSHYPSDVAAGFVIGWIAALLSAAAFARLGLVFFVDTQGRLQRKRAFRLRDQRRRLGLGSDSSPASLRSR